MTAEIRVLTLWQPYASLWADPTLPKTIETRGGPWPSTIPLPAWVLIHAAAKRPVEGLTVGAWSCERWRDSPDVPCLAPVDSIGKPWTTLPLGAVIGAAHVTHCLPIIEETFGWWDDSDTPEDCLFLPLHGPALIRPDLDGDDDFSHEEPYGIYDHGRYGYLTDRTVLFPEPIPYTGGQGFRRATPELAAQVTPYLGVPQ